MRFSPARHTRTYIEDEASGVGGFERDGRTDLLLVIAECAPRLLPVHGTTLEVLTVQRHAVGTSSYHAAHSSTEQVVLAFQLVAV